MASNTVHRDEENGINHLILSGRIVSKIFYNQKIIKTTKDFKETKTYLPQCTFVLLNGSKKHFEPYKIICQGTVMVNKIKKYATEGCRIVLEGHLGSKRRPMNKVKKYGLERFVTNIYMIKVVNIFDTKMEHDNRFDYMLKQGKIISDINNGDVYPNLNEFDSEY